MVQPPPPKLYWYSFLVPVVSVHPILRTPCMSSSSLDFQTRAPVDLYAAVEGKKQQRKSYSRTPTWNWQASLPLKINGWFRWVLSRLRRPSLFSDGINSRDLTWLDLHSEVKELCQKMSLPSNIWHRGCRMHLFFSSDSISYVRFAFHIAWLEITFPL